MKNGSVSRCWFPEYGFCAESDAIADNVFDDFDQQSEQFIGHEQSYLQISPGAFHGRFLSAFLGNDVAIHMEFCSQALEQEVCGSPDHFSFGMALSAIEPFTVKGHAFTGGDVFVLPPSGSLHLISPKQGAILAIAIQRDMLLRQPYLTASFLDWLDGLGRGVGFLRSATLAHRMREDAMAALEGAASGDERMPAAAIGQALVTSIASKTNLEWKRSSILEVAGGTVNFARFTQCRDLLLSLNALSDRTSKVAETIRLSKRSVEQAFAATVSVGPLTYLRIVRLHDVRRKLMNPRLANRTIGDIAAEHGFWDWSQFSQLYRHQFGELPSVTRLSERT